MRRSKFFTLREASAFSHVARRQNKTIVLVGGCFDILHIGHIHFLQKAKQKGTFLLVLVESDQTVRKLKGKHRPYFTQLERSTMLAELQSVDKIILLEPLTTDKEYREIIQKIHPSIIALTEHDPNDKKKKRHAENIKAKIVIIPQVKMISTSHVANLLGIE